MKKTTKKTKIKTSKTKPKIKAKVKKTTERKKITTKSKPVTSGKPCVNCKEDIHPKRLEILPFTEKCVKCSDQGKKGGITVTRGEGDHTYNEVIILEPKQLKYLEELERKEKGFIDPLELENPEYEEEPNKNEDESLESED